MVEHRPDGAWSALSTDVSDSTIGGRSLPSCMTLVLSSAAVPAVAFSEQDSVDVSQKTPEPGLQKMFELLSEGEGWRFFPNEHVSRACIRAGLLDT